MEAKAASIPWEGIEGSFNVDEMVGLGLGLGSVLRGQKETVI